MKCPRCQASCPSKARYCPACGQALQAASGQRIWKEALSRFERGDYRGAEDRLSPLLGQKGPDAAKAQAWIGHALFLRGREDEAEQAWRKALQADPSLWGAWYQLGSLAFARAQHAKAVEAFQHAADLQPDLVQHPLAGLFGGKAERARSQAYLYLGLSQRENGDLAAAEASLRQATLLSPGDPLVFGVLGDLLMGSERYAEAADCYRSALATVVDDQGLRSLRNDLGVALFQAGDLDGASEAFKTVLKEHPDDSNAMHNLGMLYLKQGLGEELRQDLKEFLKAEKAEQLLLGLTRSLVEGARGQARVPEAETGLLGRSALMRDVNEMVLRAAASSANVLLLGPNGTGKELAARAIHRLGARSAGPFVAVNCAALPETLLESELFGYEKGAFTGASAARRGRFELADGGTLFLDEIGDLQPALQVKLLRAVQEKTFERLGGNTTLHSDFRLIAATNQDLRRAVVEGRFREDLFYRLFVFPIQLPALRERGEDIGLLAEHFLRLSAAKAGKRFKRISVGALRRLRDHAWPGNVRELENLIERAVAMHDGEELDEGQLQFDSWQASDRSAQAAAAPAGLKQAEREAIIDALKRHAFKVNDAARSLGLSRATLYRKMDSHGISRLNSETKSQL